MQGRARSLTTFKTGDPVTDRYQEHVKQTLDPVLKNPLLGAVDFQWIEVQGADTSKAPTFSLQYRKPSTSGGVGTWTTIATWNSATGDMSIASSAKGDLVYANAAGVAARLAAGASSTVLTMDPAGTALPLWLTNPMMGANTGAAPSIPNNTLTIVVYGTVERDTDSGYASGTGRYTVPTSKGGDYQIVGSIAYANAIAGTPFVGIYKNAALQKAAQLNAPAASITMSCSGILNLAAGDVIDIRTQQVSGGPQVLSAQPAFCYFALKRLS